MNLVWKEKYGLVDFGSFHQRKDKSGSNTLELWDLLEYYVSSFVTKEKDEMVTGIIISPKNKVMIRNS